MCVCTCARGRGGEREERVRVCVCVAVGTEGGQIEEQTSTCPLAVKKRRKAGCFGMDAIPVSVSTVVMGAAVLSRAASQLGRFTQLLPESKRSLQTCPVVSCCVVSCVPGGVAWGNALQ